MTPADVWNFITTWYPVVSMVVATAAGLASVIPGAARAAPVLAGVVKVIDTLGFNVLNAKNAKNVP